MKKVLIAILVLVVLVLVGSQLIPSHWKVVRSAVISGKPQAIYPLVVDWKLWEKWSGFNMPGMTCTYTGKPSGVGAICTVKMKDMEVTNEIMKADPATGIVYECRMAGWPPGNCSLTFSPEGTGTLVTYTYEGTNNRNPIHRLMSLMVDKMLGIPLEAGLANLKELVEKKPTKK